MKIRRGGTYRVWTGVVERPVHVQPRPHGPPPHLPLAQIAHLDGDRRAGALEVRLRRGRGVIVDVAYDERYWYPDDGGRSGSPDSSSSTRSPGRYLARDAPALAERGLHVAAVAGAARHHAEALGSDALAPGQPLVLRRDAANPHDASAIAVDPAGGGAQAGWVPRELAAELAPDLDAGRPWSAVVLREQRPSPRDPRSGLTMLLAPAAGDRAARAGLSGPPPRAARG